MASTEPEITPRQYKAIKALLTEPTILAAAKACKVSERSLHACLKLPAFKREFRAARQVDLELHLCGVAVQVGSAIETLKRNLDLENHQPRCEPRSAFSIER
jgi:hypothetical protein